MARSSIEPLSLKKNTLWNTAGCMFYLGCQWLTTVLVVVLSSDYSNSGYLAFAMATGTMFASVALYRIRTFQVSDIDNLYSANNYVAFRIVTITSAFILAMVYSFAIAGSIEQMNVVLAYLCFKTDEVFSDVLYGIDQRHGRMDYIGISQILRGFVSLGGFCAGLYLTSTLVIAVLTMFVACLLVTMLYDLPHSARFGALRPKITRQQIKSIALVCLPGVLSTLLMTAVVSVARQYFSMVYGSEALGIYAAVATPAVIVQVACAYLYSPLIGTIAEHWYRHQYQELARLLRKTTLVMIGVIVGIVAVFGLVGDGFLKLVYGSSIEAYTYLLIPVLVGTGLIGLIGFATDVLIVMRRLWVAMTCNLVAFCIMSISVSGLIGIYYMNGINFAIILADGIGVVYAVIMIIHCINAGSVRRAGL